MKKLVLILSCLMISGCFEPAPVTVEPPPSSTQRYVDYKKSDRFSVERVGVFEDKLAYKAMRGIYLIKDSETGKEYFGISGIGVVGTGDHPSGKTRAQDEQ